MAPSETGGMDWHDVLQKNEKIVWQGRPSSYIHLRPDDYLTILFGLFFCGFALFWMAGASRAGGVFWMFGLIHFSGGAVVTTIPLIWRPLTRRRTFYTLTNRRPLIANDLPIFGRRLDIYPIAQMSELTLKPGNPGSVWFASKPNWLSFNRSRRIGFDVIPEATRVFSLITRREEEQA